MTWGSPYLVACAFIVQDLQRANSETGGVVRALSLEIHPQSQFHSQFSIEESVGTAASYVGTNFEHLADKGKSLPLDVRLYIPQNNSLTTLDFYVNPGPVCVHTGLFILHLIPGGSHE